MRRQPVRGDAIDPLVSICLYNYNYGKYLRKCLDSVLAQTYPNIEICFSDNASEDDSWNIALEYASRNPGIMTVTRNRMNFGGYANFANCMLNVRGKYFIELCSDDALAPEYVERCVKSLESHPGAAYALVHRSIIDQDGKIEPEASFYNCSCLIPGAEQGVVYMMAAVNPSVSQIMYNAAMAAGKRPVASLASRWYGARLLDFNLCCEYDMIYIKEPLLLHRLHCGNDSFKAADNLMEVIGPYVLQHQFVDVASSFERMGKAKSRLQESLAKLGQLSLRYCVRALLAGNERNAVRYFHLTLAISPETASSNLFKKVESYWGASGESRKKILEELNSISNLVARSVSYDPPPGSIPLEPNSQ